LSSADDARNVLGQAAATERRQRLAVRRALGLSVTAALLKGRANYVCHHHLDRNLGDGRFASRQDAADLRAIGRFALAPLSDAQWLCSVVRHWNLDRPDPR